MDVLTAFLKTPAGGRHVVLKLDFAIGSSQTSLVAFEIFRELRIAAALVVRVFGIRA